MSRWTLAALMLAVVCLAAPAHAQDPEASTTLLLVARSVLSGPGQEWFPPLSAFCVEICIPCVEIFRWL